MPHCANTTAASSHRPIRRANCLLHALRVPAARAHSCPNAPGIQSLRIHCGNVRLHPVDSHLPGNGNASNLLGRLLAMLKLQGRYSGCRLLVTAHLRRSSHWLCNRDPLQPTDAQSQQTTTGAALQLQCQEAASHRKWNDHQTNGSPDEEGCALPPPPPSKAKQQKRDVHHSSPAIEGRSEEEDDCDNDEDGWMMMNTQATTIISHFPLMCCYAHIHSTHNHCFSPKLIVLYYLHCYIVVVSLVWLFSLYFPMAIMFSTHVDYCYVSYAFLISCVSVVLLYCIVFFLIVNAII